MAESGLTGNKFIWDKQILGSWSKDVCTLFYNHGFGEEAFLNNKKINLHLFRESGFDQVKEQWANDIWTEPKLLTFRMIK